MKHYGQTWGSMYGEAYRQGRKDGALFVLAGVVVGTILLLVTLQGIENTKQANNQWCEVTGTDCLQ